MTTIFDIAKRAPEFPCRLWASRDNYEKLAGWVKHVEAFNQFDGPRVWYSHWSPGIDGPEPEAPIKSISVPVAQHPVITEREGASIDANTKQALAKAREVERPVSNGEVGGSSPSRGSSFPSAPQPATPQIKEAIEDLDLDGRITDALANSWNHPEMMGLVIVRRDEFNALLKAARSASLLLSTPFLAKPADGAGMPLKADPLKHPQIHVDYYAWLGTLKGDFEQKFIAEHSRNFQEFNAIAMWAWSQSRETISARSPQREERG